MDHYNESLVRRNLLEQMSRAKPAEQVNRKVRYIRDHLLTSMYNNNRHPGLHWIELQALDVNGVNVAEGIMPSAQPGFDVTNLEYATDGITNISNQYANFTGNGVTPVYIQVDLGEPMDIYSVKVWHYHFDKRTFFSKLEVSADGVEWTTLFDSISDETTAYPESAAGKSYRIVPIEWPADGFRYVRDTVTEGTAEPIRIWAELQVNTNDGYNLALGRPVSIQEGFQRSTGHGYISSVTDGCFQYTGEGYLRVEPSNKEPAYIQLDLGKVYKPSEIVLSHYYNYGFFKNHLQVSTNGFVWHTVHDWRIDGLMEEPINGHVFKTPWTEDLNPDKGIRYIREYQRYNNAHSYRLFNEIEVHSASDGNVARGKIATVQDGFTVRNAGFWTDGSGDTNSWAEVNPPSRDWAYLELDLGKVYDDLLSIVVYHYHKDGDEQYTYRLEVSADGVVWDTIWSTPNNGFYHETADGKTHSLFTRLL